MKTVRRWLSHDEPVTVMLPKNLDTYTPVEDIRFADLADRAMLNHNGAYAAAYTETVQFTGTLGGIGCSVEQRTAPTFQWDPDRSTIRYRSEYEQTVTMLGQTETDGQALSYENGKLVTTWADGSETEKSIRQQEVIDSVFSNFLALTLDAAQTCYHNPVYTSEDGLCTVLMEPDAQMSLIAFPFAFYSLNLQTPDAYFEVADYEIREASGRIVIEEATEQVKMISIYIDASFTMTDGTVFEGTALVEQTFEGYDRDVVIAPGEDGIRRP